MMRVGGYDIDIVVQGFPGKSVCHGGLGWSSVVLLRGRGRLGLIDAGSFGMRRLLLARLAQRGLKPQDVTDVILTHSHHDHAVNWVLFRHARIVIGAAELTWSLEVPWGETPVPELYMRELQGWPTLHKAEDGAEVFPGLTAHVAPGHTPGSLVYVLEGDDRDVIFTGDAAKNRAEMLSRTADATYDRAATAASIDMIWDLWRRRPGSILVPGHDVPMVQDGGACRYLGTRDAAIEAWFDDDLEKTTVFQLTA
jgi:N-acyl homoserine lactone hydrolase